MFETLYFYLDNSFSLTLFRLEIAESTSLKQISKKQVNFSNLYSFSIDPNNTRDLSFTP